MQPNSDVEIHPIYGAGRLSRQPDEGRARRVGRVEGFCTSLVGNMCSVPILRPFVHSIFCGDMSAVANISTSKFNKVIPSK
jgi:hypothetical protein